MRLSWGLTKQYFLQVPSISRNSQKKGQSDREKEERNEEVSNREGNLEDTAETNKNKDVEEEQHLKKARRTSFKEIRRKGSLVVNASIQKMFGERKRQVSITHY